MESEKIVNWKVCMYMYSSNSNYPQYWQYLSNNDEFALTNRWRRRRSLIARRKQHVQMYRFETLFYTFALSKPLRHTYIHMAMSTEATAQWMSVQWSQQVATGVLEITTAVPGATTCWNKASPDYEMKTNKNNKPQW